MDELSEDVVDDVTVDVVDVIADVVSMGSVDPEPEPPALDADEVTSPVVEVLGNVVKFDAVRFASVDSDETADV